MSVNSVVVTALASSGVQRGLALGAAVLLVIGDAVISSLQSGGLVIPGSEGPLLATVAVFGVREIEHTIKNKAAKLSPDEAALTQQAVDEAIKRAAEAQGNKYAAPGTNPSA